MFEFTPYFIWFARNPEVSLFASGGQAAANVSGQSYYIAGVTRIALRMNGKDEYTITGKTLKIVFNVTNMNENGKTYSYIALSTT